MYIKDNGEKVYSLKEKYEYYKRKANNPSAKISMGKKKKQMKYSKKYC